MAGWTEEEIASRSGHEVVDVAFTEPDGHLNRFEPMDKWLHVFKDKHWQVNDFVRPHVKLLSLCERVSILSRRCVR